MRNSVSRILWSAGFLLVMVGCKTVSTPYKPLHGFNVTNRGATPINNVVIRYGPVTQSFCKPICGAKNGGGGGWFAYMAIEDEMTVTWNTSDGLSHMEAIAVREKLLAPDRLNSLMFFFVEEKLTVLQGLSFVQPSAVGLETFPLFNN